MHQQAVSKESAAQHAERPARAVDSSLASRLADLRRTYEKAFDSRQYARALDALIQLGSALSPSGDAIGGGLPQDQVTDLVNKILFARSEIEQARQLIPRLQTQLRVSRKNGRTWLRLAQALWSTGCERQAYRAFLHAMNREETLSLAEQSEALRGLAWCCQIQGDSEAARDLCAQARLIHETMC